MAGAEKSQNLVPNPSGDEKDFIEWTAISLTHVEYPKGDIVGKVLAMLSLVPVSLLVSFFTLIIFRRELHTMCYLLGILINEIINWVLKHLIREIRPIRDRAVLFSEFGMPSSHSQFMWFFSIYLTFFLFVRVYKNCNWYDDLWKYVISLSGFLSAILVSYSRVYLGYHTVSQITWGGIIGLTLGTVWFLVVQFLLTPLFPFIASSPIGEFFMVRDSTLIPHVLWFEYTSSRSEARSRQRKVTSRKSQ
ncbi:hypothetical protein LOTGIDRAFT_237774 [Lottia gigantea]|uniref:Dolichyldiphosphatase n=1 Tax=Lottia gigantea TaxID=225164 RepID=V4B6T9_LOTGI|nr:hypothetical protein LOTGIDRAFT_237774 [Lottia gigantea]ESP03246.1 hypothetical protein LOTGIDRAFT_237774 [Lottia gigantea]